MRGKLFAELIDGVNSGVDGNAFIAQRHRDARDLRHVEARGHQLVAAGEDLARRAAHQHVAVRQDNDAVDVFRDLLHAVAHEHDGRAARAVEFADV